MKNEQKYKTPSKQETIADIVAEMLEFAETDSQTIGRDVLRRRIQHFVASIIEAVAKREVTDCNHLGNVAKMREALERCASMGEQIDNQLGSSEDTVYAFRGERCLAHNISECARAALSAPPRNCDVGTADEQHARFYSFCDKIEECKKCPLWRGGGLTSKCSVYWAQLPYEEGCEK